MLHWVLTKESTPKSAAGLRRIWRFRWVLGNWVSHGIDNNDNNVINKTLYIILYVYIYIYIYIHNYCSHSHLCKFISGLQPTDL